MKYTLNFKSDDYGKKTIDEPFGVDGMIFSLNQRTDGGGMARDVSFTGGNNLFEFTNQREHQLKQLLYYKKMFGFESEVVLTIEMNNGEKYSVDLDFADSETDGYSYFKCKGLEDGKLQIIKARKKTKVDLFSSEDIDGNYINPLVPDNMLILAKPVSEVSQWKNEVSTTYPRTLRSYQNFLQQSTSFEISSSYTPFQVPSTLPELIESPLIELEDNATNVVLKIKTSMICLKGTSGNSAITLRYYAGKKTASQTEFGNNSVNIDSTYVSGGPRLTVDREINIGNLNRGEVVYVYAVTSTGTISDYNTLTVDYYDVSVTTDSLAYNSISKSLRLIDVMRQVILSISGLQITAPRFEYGGEFYDNRLVSGNLLRGITENGFNVSLEDLENSFDEFKGDYEINSDGKIFFGIEEDFYNNVESGFFNDTQFDSMNETFNPKFKVNTFKYEYKNYQSQKENEELNSADTIHGESIFTFFNKNVENEKNPTVEWTRDAFLIEATRTLASTITETTASQDDDTLFAIDSITTTIDNVFTEVTELQHTYDTVNSRLVLRGNGSVNFESLGIIPNSIFTILTTDINAGTYRVYSVDFGSVQLTRLLGITTASGDGIRATK